MEQFAGLFWKDGATGELYRTRWHGISSGRKVCSGR